MTISTQGSINFSRRNAGTFGGVDQCLINHQTQEDSSHDLLLGMVPNLLPTEFELQTPEHSLHLPSANSGSMDCDCLHVRIRGEAELPLSPRFPGNDDDASHRLRAKASAKIFHAGLPALKWTRFGGRFMAFVIMQPACAAFRIRQRSNIESCINKRGLFPRNDEHAQ